MRSVQKPSTPNACRPVQGFGQRVTLRRARGTSNHIPAALSHEEAMLSESRRRHEVICAIDDAFRGWQRAGSGTSRPLKPFTSGPSILS